MNRLPATAPLDPDGDHGREVADRLTDTLADLLNAVRSRAAQNPAGTDREEAA